MINKFKNFIVSNNLDGYVIPKNDEFFTEYSKINKLKIVANFTGSAGFILILKNTNQFSPKIDDSFLIDYSLFKKEDPTDLIIKNLNNL